MFRLTLYYAGLNSRRPPLSANQKATAVWSPFSAPSRSSCSGCETSPRWRNWRRRSRNSASGTTTTGSWRGPGFNLRGRPVRGCLPSRLLNDDNQKTVQGIGCGTFPQHQDRNSRMNCSTSLDSGRCLGHRMPHLRFSAVAVDSARLREPAHSRLMVAGNLDLVSVDLLGLICLGQCPGSLVLRTYDCVHERCDLGAVLAGGFHSPMERAQLRILLRGKQEVVIRPARSIDGMHLPAEWRPAFEAGRLLILPVFGPSERRITRELASRRNPIVASICRRLLVPHVAPGSKTLSLFPWLLSQGKAIETFNHEANGEILAAGAALAGTLNSG